MNCLDIDIKSANFTTNGSSKYSVIFDWMEGDYIHSNDNRLVAGLQVGWALGCSGFFGLGSAVPVPHVPGHPTPYAMKALIIIIIIIIIIIRSVKEGKYVFMD